MYLLLSSISLINERAPDCFDEFKLMVSSFYFFKTSFRLLMKASVADWRSSPIIRWGDYPVYF
jgi:hypothetical protein